MNESSLAKSQSLDIYRKTCLRYLGYFGLLGRICSPVLPGNIVKTVAMSYILSDVADKSFKTAKQGGGNKVNLLVNASDAIIWQTASSILIPAFLLKSFTEHARKLKIHSSLARFRSGALPYVLGFAFMPFLSYPIDKSVNFIMDNSYRKWFKGGSKKYESAVGPIEQTSRRNKKYSNCDGDFDKIYDEIKSRSPQNQTKELESSPRKSKSSNKQAAKQSNKQSDKQSNKQSNKSSNKKSKKQSDKQLNNPSNKESNTN